MFFANDQSELLTVEQLLQMSGLAFMQQMLDGQVPAPPISQSMGYRLHAVEDGRAVFRGAPSFDMTNPMGSVHGGWYGTLLDSAMACAVMTKVARGSLYTTLEYKINIIRSIPVDMEIECIGELDHTGRSTAVAHGEIRGVKDKRLYATGSTTCIIMDMSKRA
jgi:uncharacterized protein (TIGR00369 family)